MLHPWPLGAAQPWGGIVVSWAEQRLFVEEFEAVSLMLWNDFETGWSLRSHGRRRAASWADDQASYYSELARAEALDVAAAEVVRYLEL